MNTSTPTAPTLAAVYLRVSLDTTGEGLAVDRQREDCLRIVAQRGWTVAEVYTDNSISASKKNVRRPDYDRMVGDYAAGKFDALVCWDLDRLTRQPRQLEDWIDAAEARGLLLVTANGEADLTVDSGRMFARIKAAVARQEVERKGARQRRANEQRVAQGKPNTSCGRRFGYESDGMRIVESEAVLVREAYAAIVAGGSVNGITTRWNRAGAVTVPGNKWAATSVRKVLTNPYYAGLAAHLGEIVGQGRWPGVVTEDVWRAVQHVLTAPERATTQDHVTKRLLASIAVCGVCGAKMGGGYRAPGKKPAADAPRTEIVYRCKDHSCVARSAGPIDQYVTEQVLWRLSQPDALALAVKPVSIDVDATRTEAAALRARLDEAALLYADGTLTATDLRTTNARLREKLAAAEAMLAEAGRKDAVVIVAGADDVATAWAGLDIHAQRSIVKALFSRMTIERVGRGQWRKTAESVAGTVTVEWRAQA
jgi:DNA invertase Pin-like site-specific DNA recombinase